jgi:hypothetical protein
MLTYHSTSTVPNLVTGDVIHCSSDRIRFTAHPGHRLAVRSGTWKGQSASGLPVALHVGLGGRILESDPTRTPAGSFTFGQWSCSQSLCTAGHCASDIVNDVMIAPDGTFDSGDDPGLDGRATGTFTRSRAAHSMWSGDAGGQPGPCDSSWTAAHAG